MNNLINNIQELQIDDFNKEQMDKEKKATKKESSIKIIEEDKNKLGLLNVAVKNNRSQQKRESISQSEIDRTDNFLNHNSSCEGNPITLRHASIVTFGNKSDQENKFEKNDSSSNYFQGS